MIRTTGVGDLFINSFGAIDKHVLGPGEQLVVDNYHLVAFTNTCEYEVRKFGSWKDTLFWELYELDEKRTLARFGTALEVGPALPTFLQDMVTRSKLPASIEHCRKWVNSDGTYRP